MRDCVFRAFAPLKNPSKRQKIKPKALVVEKRLDCMRDCVFRAFDTLKNRLFMAIKG
jgi:hypothetical protein